MVTCSNLTDEGSREEVAEKLREAQMPEEKICNFLLWAEEFNQLEGYNLQTGFTSMDGEMVFYVPRFSMAQRWAEKRGNYDDLLCRTVAFYLVEDFLSLTDSQSSTMMVCDKELMRGGQLVTYLVAKQQSFGADFGKIFVMENNILLH